MYHMTFVILLYLKTFVFMLLISTTIYIVFQNYLLSNNVDLHDVANTLVTVVHCKKKKSGVAGTCRRKSNWAVSRRK
jgi:hypothetical protein